LAVIIADTDVLTDFLVGAQPVANQIVEYIKTEQIQTTAVTSFELLSGANDSKRGQAVRRLIDALHVLPLDRDAARRAAEVRRKLDRAGQAIGMADSLIAGIVLAHGLRLFTRNKAHFQRVENLELVKIGAATS
jgi:predicted nucleic acid-binding protein